MSAIKNVAIFGGSGELGTPILSALIASNKFKVTVISRTDSKSTFPSGIKVIQADYTSLSSLTSALSGIDAVVSTVGNSGFTSQPLIFDAAVAAGVTRFIPSEFGSDLANASSSALPVFGYKVAVRKHIEEAIAAGAKITYTYIINGGFLDWGLEKNFLLAWANGKPTLYDGGDALFSSTSLASIGTATVNVLLNLEQTTNRSVYIEDIQLSQKKLLTIAQKAAPERSWEPVTKSLEEVSREAYEGLQKGDLSVIVNFIYVSIFGGEKYGNPWPKNDNKLLGVEGKTEADVEKIFKELFAKAK